MLSADEVDGRRRAQQRYCQDPSSLDALGRSAKNSSSATSSGGSSAARLAAGPPTEVLERPEAGCRRALAVSGGTGDGRGGLTDGERRALGVLLDGGAIPRLTRTGGASSATAC